MTRKYALAAGKDFLDPVTKHVERTADEIIAGLKKFHVMNVTLAEYAKLPAREKAALKKQSGFLIGGSFNGGKTKNDCVSRSIVTLDFDDLTAQTAEALIAALKQVRHRGFIYSTASHTAERPRLRAFIFLARDIEPQHYKRLVQHFADTLPAAVSAESWKVGQIMYRPARCSDGAELALELPGEPLNPDPILAAPQTEPERPSTSNPAWNIPGIVGAVARHYEGDFDRAIVELGLPYSRSEVGATCGPGEDRYSYTKGQGADGAIWYRKDGHFFSHHGSDPCFNTNATIFDVWRLHNAKPELDDLSLPLHERASHRAAEAFFAATFPDIAQGTRTASPDEMEALPPLQEMVSTNPGRFHVVLPEEFVKSKPEAWILKGILPKAELAVVFGASGSGKSFLVLDWCAAIVRGELWRDRKTKKSSVVYVCAEGSSGFKKRMRAYVKVRGGRMQDMPAVVADAPNLLNQEDVADLIAALKAHGPVDMVVIDTLSATTPGGNENEGKDVGRALGHCKAIHKATGALVLLVHHSGKDATKGARGWSGLRAAADTEVEISRVGDMRVATLTKGKDVEDGLQWGFKLQQEVLGLDEDGDDITSCVVIDVPFEMLPTKAKPPKGGKGKETTKALVAQANLAGMYEKEAVAGYMKGSKSEMKKSLKFHLQVLEELIHDGFLYQKGNKVSAEPFTGDEE